MTNANQKQVGGDHYKSKYEHWDAMTDIGMPYVPATAIKYLTRWKKKNGRQDLEKAKHYIEKALEVADHTRESMREKLSKMYSGNANIEDVEKEIIDLVAFAFAPDTGPLEDALDTITGLIQSTEAH